jgi:hypothetical protein
MTIDERLERLTERHEALTQSAELLVAQGRESDRRLDALAERHEALTQSVELLASGVGRLSREVSRISVGVDKILIIVTVQNERIKRVEDKSAA